VPLAQQNVQMDGAVIQGQRVMELEIILAPEVNSGLMILGIMRARDMARVAHDIVLDIRVNAVMVPPDALNKYNPRKNETPFSMYYN